MTVSSTPIEIKACCSALYESDWARLLLGDSFHPGGLALTERLGALLGLTPESRLLDVASGRGTSAIHLARTFGCHVTGIDLSQENMELARETARREGHAEQVRFTIGDAEALPFASDSFDAVISECALCTFPNKPAAVMELSRVLRPGGRIGISDVTRSGNLPDELEGALAVAACIADARSAESYADLFRAAGFIDVSIEGHDDAMLALVKSVRTKLLGAQLLVRTNQIVLPEITIDRGKTLAKHASEAIANGLLGYAIVTAAKASA